MYNCLRSFAGWFFLLLASNYSAQAQQNFIFPNFNRNLALVSPAMMGMDSATTFSAGGRKQWTGINDAPAAINATGSTFFRRPGMSAGVALEHKKVAVTSYTSLGIMLSKTVNLSNTERLTLGFYGGADNFSHNYGGVGGGDPALGEKQRVNTWRGVIGAGLTLHGERYYFGLSAPRIALKNDTRPDLRPEDKTSNGYFTGGILLPLNDNFSLAPAFMWNVLHASRALDAGATLFIRETAGIGATYRTTGEMNATLQYFLQRRLQAGYSYIFSVGNSYNISRFSGGSHEVFVSYRLGNATLPFKWW